MSVSLLRTDEEMTDIYNKYIDTVYRIALMTLKNVPEAEDAAQTVFIKLMTSGSEFESEEHMRAWLIVTAQNTCRNLLKGWWRSKRVDSEIVIEQTCLPDALGNDIWDRITALEEKYKLPIYLHYYEGYKTDEIAEMLKVNHATLRTRLRTARKKLKLLLEEDIENG
ncbi:RNA polymerase sigma-70 factor, ECF subfamily [Sporobacter termitidis DSM 10068]|uniref:RNA polymerase sigma-70 factor, ECF subfamily n=1 Tax=Sporobacter termitidis DSM 10068 TaxID=1123282 RepID=A0A1M5XT68_9FIRM|nr:sigma-70 family RNA polymerase sigma factor [Sporobacter termitidis]SHI02966.1 RNA polymerase sigma-70 factor, ECF subfamily [Sporobacter termitidis DSM 10068]